MSECKDHIGEYEKSAACLVCLVSYWSQTVVPMRDKRIAELEAQLADESKRLDYVMNRMLTWHPTRESIDRDLAILNQGSE